MTYVHPDEPKPDLDPTADIPTQLRALIAWADARLANDRANRQICLEELLDYLAPLAFGESR